MKKPLFFIALALLLTTFSCTPEEFETQPKKKIETVTKSLQAGDEKPDGPGDKPTPPTKP